MAATAWPTNGHLIADCARLGYIHDSDLVLDPTYGRGTWWKVWRPRQLVTHDMAIDAVDFRQLPEADGTFDVVAFDPPYMAPGGRSTSTLGDFNARFGLHSTARTPAENQAVNLAGLKEVLRVTRPRGIVLTKCCDYVNGGKLFPGTHLTLSYAIEIGFELVDRFEHFGRNPRPQPHRSRRDGKPVVQQHARRNVSTLFVLRAPR